MVRLAQLMRRHERSARLVGVRTNYPGQPGTDSIAFPASGENAVIQVPAGWRRSF
jgi:hypothetical protein